MKASPCPSPSPKLYHLLTVLSALFRTHNLHTACTRVIQHIITNIATRSQLGDFSVYFWIRRETSSDDATGPVNSITYIREGASLWLFSSLRNFEAGFFIYVVCVG